jgi:hypothetical protein
MHGVAEEEFGACKYVGAVVLPAARRLARLRQAICIKG